MSREHQHLTTEQLSACIDKQLSVEEQSLVDEHLKQCELCQLWVKELRATARLVRALPQPQLPRSFALPADILVAPLPAQTKQASRIVTTHRARSSRMRITIRVMSALAAVVGIVFLLSGFMSFSHNTASSDTLAPSAESASLASPASIDVSNQSNQLYQTRQANQAVKPQVMSTSIGQATANFVPQARASVEPQKQPEHAPNSSTSSASPVFLFEPSQSSGCIALGIILLILGCAGFVYLRFQRS